MLGVSTVETISVKKDNSIEGDIEQYGQKSMSTTKRNLMNKDEILRIQATKLIVNLRGNKPILLDKVIYTEHELSKKLNDSLVTEYNPKWTKNSEKVVHKKEEKKQIDIPKKEEKISWNNF